MGKDNLTVERHYEPDEDAMLNALSLIFRAKSPPGQTEVDPISWTGLGQC